MNFLDAIILGIVEGLTEFLPVSSTGHLILTRELLGLEDSDFVKAFEVIIQSGAMMAVLWHCRGLVFGMLRGLFFRESAAIQQILNLMAAFFPAAILGFCFGKQIKTHLFSSTPVIAALIIGGIALIIIERNFPAKTAPHDEKMPANMNAFMAFKIGLAQCLALWPGTSRAMATILGGRLVGLSPKQAAEFSLLLAIPTLFAASGYDLYKVGPGLLQDSSQLLALSVGCAVSFIVALIVIKVFLHYLARHSLEVFGWYRILAGIAMWIVLH